MDINPWWIVAGIGLLALTFGGLWLRLFGRAVQIERARELFRLQQERYEETLLAAAAAGGKPRGLRWLRAVITGDALITRNAKREIVALVPVQIDFEPIEGSEMENVPMAREPRVATAVFTFRRGEWHTDGRIVFNLAPRQAAKHFGLAYA
jgi:hypothetical protein